MSAFSSEADVAPGEKLLRDADTFDPEALRTNPGFEAVAVKSVAAADGSPGQCRCLLRPRRSPREAP